MLTLALALLLTDPPPTPPPTTAQDVAKTVDRVNGFVQGGPLGGVLNLLTGRISADMQARIAKSEWVMTTTQKYASRGIAEHLSKIDKVQWTATNSKVDGLCILILTSEAVSQERAEKILKDEPLWKWKRCGWDRLVFTNGKDAWAFATE